MIDETFESADRLRDLRNIRHPGKPDLEAVQVYPVLPNFRDWSDMFVHCYFDDDPAVKPIGKLRSEFSAEESEERRPVDSQLEQAILKPMVDPSRDNEQFMIYFLPPTVDEEDRNGIDAYIAGNHNSPLEKMDAIRHYNFRLEKEETMEKIFFTFDESLGALYNQVQGQVRLKKRRLQSRQQFGSGSQLRGSAASDAETPTVLQLKRVRRNEQEDDERNQLVQRQLGVVTTDE
jgi:hypothetical protein